MKGVLVQKIDIFKELTPRSRTYELRDQGGKKKNTKSKTNRHLSRLVDTRGCRSLLEIGFVGQCEVFVCLGFGRFFLFFFFLPWPRSS